ncbi:glycosyltransferase family 4 protein [Luteibacter sp. 3190]|uniref:glycosyltransferase family 4 protein n=1 Tax=Luteibacter sp. 3190 TaxID=2817736 RepID=UPI002854D9C7|nr:glycosyltransferase family 4 protein [Luteibacter sp. 3190]MDR6935610.1 glycosyltransferase involved in cell wall biosynthesis [Luteibacter sp. 3190]
MSVRRVMMSADAVGGVWTFALQLAEGLRRHGIEVLIAVLGPRPDSGRLRAAGRVPGLTLAHGDFPLEWMAEANDANQEAAGRWLLGLAHEFAPDIVHLNHFCHGHLPWPAPCVVVAHSCVATWYEHVRGTAPGPEWDGYRRRVARGLAGAALVTAPTRSMLDDLRRLYGHVGRVAVVHNGRDPEAFRGTRKQPYVLCAARAWDEAKNVAALDAAAPASRWPIRVAGDVRHPEGGSARFDHVQLLGALGEGGMASQFAHAAIYVLPARYEPFGLSVLEAAFAGCALVLGDIPSLRELWEDTACYVPSDDPAAIARTLNALVDDRPKLHAHGMRARRHARRYTADRMVARWRDTYRDMAREGGRPCVS